MKRGGVGDAPRRATSLTRGERDSSAFPAALSTVLEAQRSLSLSSATSHVQDAGLAEPFQRPGFAPNLSETWAHVNTDDPPALSLSRQPPFYSKDVSQMYDNILHQPLQIPVGRTVAACDLLQALLHKDQRQRLGSKADFLEIKNHVFFSPINWDDLYHKRLTPPFNPNVAGPADLKHFDPEFTEEAVSKSIGCTPDTVASSAGAASAFLGFSYVPEDDAVQDC